MMDCTSCERQAATEPIPRWKAPLLFVGALLFCPCHLPVTFAGVALLGGAAFGGTAWFYANKPLVYGVFSVLYVVLVVLLYRWFMRSRDRDREIDELHAEHAAKA